MFTATFLSAFKSKEFSARGLYYPQQLGWPMISTDVEFGASTNSSESWSEMFTVGSFGLSVEYYPHHLGVHWFQDAYLSAQVHQGSTRLVHASIRTCSISNIVTLSRFAQSLCPVGYGLLSSIWNYFCKNNNMKKKAPKIKVVDVSDIFFNLSF